MYVYDYTCINNITEILLPDNTIETPNKMIMPIKSQHNDWLVKPIGEIRLLKSRVVVAKGKSGYFEISKYQTLLDQTLYLKKDVSIPSKNKVAFSLAQDKIRELINNPLLARNTFRKILQVIDILLSGDTDYDKAANKLKVDKEIFSILMEYACNNC